MNRPFQPSGRNQEARGRGYFALNPCLTVPTIPPHLSPRAVPGYQSTPRGSAYPSEQLAFQRPCPTRRPGRHAVQYFSRPHVRQHLPNQGKLLNAGNDPQPASAIRTVSLSMANTRLKRWTQHIGARGLSLSTRSLGWCLSWLHLL